MVEFASGSIELNDLNIEVERISNKRDASLEILNNSGALEEYNSIEERKVGTSYMVISADFYIQKGDVIVWPAAGE